MIFITHGVVPQWKVDRISHALVVSEPDFADYLQRRASRFVPLVQAITGGGDALTVDDATYAGLRAVLLARLHGHAVSWFVNGAHVEQHLSYFPFQLSSLLDETLHDECYFDGLRWNLKRLADRRTLRLYLKQVYMRMVNLEQIDQMVQAVACCLDVDPCRLEKALSTVTPADLAMAAASGAELHNHGWSHLNPLNLSKQEVDREVQTNEEYLACFRQPTARVFAPPFGKEVALSSGAIDYMVLADRRLISSHQASGPVVNRSDLHAADCFPLIDRAQETFLQTESLGRAL